MFQWEDLCISVEVVSCRLEVAVEGPGSLLLSCCPVVAEAVSKGFGGLTNIYFGAFTADDTIDEVSTRAGEGICEVEELLRGSGGDGMIREEQWR